MFISKNSDQCKLKLFNKTVGIEFHSSLKDFSIAAEFKCYNYVDLWHDLEKNNYSQVKLHLDSSVRTI